jgi:diadenosine tetraphosphate (Ap4A) HIT family hydrolase
MLKYKYNLKGSKMHFLIYEDHEIYIEKEESEVPWLKIFTQEPYRELGDIPKELRSRLWKIYDEVEVQMKAYYKPTKINMASFANMLPRVHIHVMARFENDSYFPNPMWGEKLRDSQLSLPNEEEFHKRLFEALQKL